MTYDRHIAYYTAWLPIEHKKALKGLKHGPTSRKPNARAATVNAMPTLPLQGNHILSSTSRKM